MANHGKPVALSSHDGPLWPCLGLKPWPQGLPISRSWLWLLLALRPGGGFTVLVAATSTGNFRQRPWDLRAFHILSHPFIIFMDVHGLFIFFGGFTRFHTSCVLALCCTPKFRTRHLAGRIRPLLWMKFFSSWSLQFFSWRHPTGHLVGLCRMPPFRMSHWTSWGRFGFPQPQLKDVDATGKGPGKEPLLVTSWSLYLTVASFTTLENTKRHEESTLALISRHRTMPDLDSAPPLWRMDFSPANLPCDGSPALLCFSLDRLLSSKLLDSNTMTWFQAPNDAARYSTPVNFSDSCGKAHDWPSTLGYTPQWRPWQGPSLPFRLPPETISAWHQATRFRQAMMGRCQKNKFDRFQYFSFMMAWWV